MGGSKPVSLRRQGQSQPFAQHADADEAYAGSPLIQGATRYVEADLRVRPGLHQLRQKESHARA
jgi:hypothetical protein